VRLAVTIGQWGQAGQILKGQILKGPLQETSLAGYHLAGRHAAARTFQPWRVGQLAAGDGDTPTSVS
jgi:hypothetical protein